MPELSLGNLYRTKADKSHTHEGSEITSTVANATTATKLQNSITINGTSFDGSSNITINAIDSNEKGVANGVATLDASGLIPASQLSNGSNSNVNILNSNTNYIADGRKFGMPNGFTLPITEGTEAINGNGISRDANSITLDARKAALVYDDADGNTGKIEAKYPIDYIDDNTVGFWIFNQPAGSVVPNSAIGKSSIAVANDLIPSGTLTRVDGRCDYALKSDGLASTYLRSANYTGFPIGANERELMILVTVAPNDLTGLKNLMGNGTAAGNGFSIDISSGVIGVTDHSSVWSSVYSVDSQGLYLIDARYDGSILTINVNGKDVYSSGPLTFATAASVYTFFSTFNTSQSSASTLHFAEIRNKCRTPQEIAEIATKLLFPVCYDKINAAYPTLNNSDKALVYHEYKFDEASGTTVIDNAGTLNGTAVGTTIVDSRLELGKARKFNGSSDYIDFGTDNLPDQFTVVFLMHNYKLSVINCLFGKTNTSTTNAKSPLWVRGYTDGRLNIELGDGSITQNVDVTGLTNGTNFVAYSIDGKKVSARVNNTIIEVAQTIQIAKTADYILFGKSMVSGYANYFNGDLDYLLIIPRALSQVEIAEIYDSLMAKGRKSLKSILPANSVSLGYVETNSNEIVSINDTDWAYGRRENAVNGNRKIFIWMPFIAGTTKKIVNPFKTENILISDFMFKKNITDNKHSQIDVIYDSGQHFGCYCSQVDAYNITINSPTSYLINSSNSYTVASESSGYIGCYIEVLEDDLV